MLINVCDIRVGIKRIWCIAWNHKGTMFISSGEDKCLRLWNLTNDLKWESQLSLPESHKRSVRSISWSPCDKYIASASFDGTVAIWKLNMDSSSVDLEAIATLEGHTSEVKCVSWSPSGGLLTTCGRDRSVWFWEFDDEEDVQCVSVLQSHVQDVKSVSWHPTGEVVVSTSYDNTINLYKEELDDWVAFVQLSGHTSTVWKASFSPNGDILASCSDDRCIKLWVCEVPIIKSRSSDWLCISNLSGYHTDTIFDIAWSPDGQFLSSCGADNRICIFRIPENGVMQIAGKPAFNEPPSLWTQMENAHTEDINCVTWQPIVPEEEAKCYKLVTASDDGSIKLWSFKL